MAISLESFTTPASTALNGITTSFNTLTTNTFSNTSGFPSGVNAVSRNLSQNSLANPNANPLSAIGSLSNQLLGDFNPISKFAGQGAAALGAISKLSNSLPGGLGTGKVPSIQSLLAGKLSASGLGSFAASLESLGSIGSTVAKSSIGPFNAVSVVNRSAQELRGTSEVQRAREFMTSSKPSVLDQTSSSAGASYVKNAAGRIENPLRASNSFNYIITLGILDPQQLNNPSSYRSSPFRKILLKSGGGERNIGYANRIRTYAEGEENAEYFIDDLNINAVIAPNPNTSTALGTNVNFKIVEPFSMGKIIEAMMIGAQECGYNSYMEAPFCFKIEFCGWDERGETDVDLAKPAYIPIRINKMELQVGQQGCVYDCTAVPYSESALGDVANKTRVATSTQGDTVHAVLETAKDSVTYTINGQIETLEDKKILRGYDRYIIAFPKNRQDIIKAVEGEGFNLQALQDRAKAEEQERVRLGVGQPVRNPNSGSDAAVTPVIAPSAADQYLFLKAWASDPANMNEFGLSALTADTRSGGDRPMPAPASTVNPETQTNNRQNVSAAVPEKSRKFNFSEGAKITDIIQEVLLSSVYVQEQTQAASQNGFKKHFRVETMVFIVQEKAGDDLSAQVGRPRKVFVYAVHPFWTYEARHLAPGQRPPNVDQLKSQAKKEYNYYYTGQNEDVLDFDIKFNTAFFQNIRADLGQNRAVSVDTENSSTGARPGTTVPTDVEGQQRAALESAIRQQEAVSSVEITAANKSVSTGGTRVGSVDASVKRAIAEQFHNRLINSPADMITVEMSIWGDPYYIPSDVGNYSAPPAEPTVTGDGTMAYVRDEVYVVVNFLTPLDYLTGQATMSFPTTVKPFSGLYQVISTQSSFNQAKFTQKLKMIRVPGQNNSQDTVNGSGVMQMAGKDKVTVNDASAYADENPQNRPTPAPSVNTNDILSRIQNQNNETGANASFSQTRLMTGESGSTEAVVTNPVSSIASAVPAEALAGLPIDAASRLGITANLTSTVFPLKLPSNYTSNLPASLAAVNASNVSQALQRSGLNGPAGGGLPFNIPSVSGLPPLPGLNGALTQAAGGLASVQSTLSRVQSTVNTAASGLSTQARGIGLRPPIG